MRAGGRHCAGDLWAGITGRAVIAFVWRATRSGGRTTVEAGRADIRSIGVIRFGLFGFLKFWVLKNENRNFQKYFRNRTRIDSQFRFGLFGPPNRPEL
jgi:hypothetical protein